MSEASILELAEINPPLKSIPAPDVIVGFIPMQAVREQGGLSEVQEAYFRDVSNGFTRFHDNDVLFAKITPCMENGKGALVENLPSGIGTGSTEFFVLRSRPESDAGYVYQLMQWERTRIKAEAFMSGSAGQQRVLPIFFKRYKVFAPRREIQGRIACILQTIDQAIEKTEALIEKYQQIKAGLMHDLFTRGIGPDGQLRPPREQAPELYKETPIGWIPKEWNAKEISDIANVRYGVNEAIDQNLKEGVPTITLPCVSPDGDLSLDRRLMAVTAISQVTEDLILREGDLLFNWRNGSSHHLGKTAIFTGDGHFTHVGFLLRIRPNENLVIPNYLWEQLRFQKLKGVFLRAKQQVNNTFNSEELRRLLVAVPPIEEQRRICSGLSKLGNRVTVERQLLENLNKRKSGLMHDLLTGKVPVQAEPESESETAHV